MHISSFHFLSSAISATTIRSYFHLWFTHVLKYSIRFQYFMHQIIVFPFYTLSYFFIHYASTIMNYSDSTHAYTRTLQSKLLIYASIIRELKGCNPNRTHRQSYMPNSTLFSSTSCYVILLQFSSLIIVVAVLLWHDYFCLCFTNPLCQYSILPLFYSQLFHCCTSISCFLFYGLHTQLQILNKIITIFNTQQYLSSQ